MTLRCAYLIGDFCEPLIEDFCEPLAPPCGGCTQVDRHEWACCRVCCRAVRTVQNERHFVRSSQIATRIVVGITVSLFVIMRQMISYADYNLELLDFDACATKISHGVTGSVMVGAVMLVLWAWLARRYDVRPWLQDLTSLLLCSGIQIAAWSMVFRHSDLYGESVQFMIRNHTVDPHGIIHARFHSTLNASEVASQVASHLHCDRDQHLAIHFNAMIVICLVICCGFLRACVSVCATRTAAGTRDAQRQRQRGAAALVRVGLRSGLRLPLRMRMLLLGR